MPYKFRDYTREELEKCGDALVADVHNLYRPGKGEEPSTEEWTELILDWFAHAAAPHHLVDGRRSDTRANWKLRWPKLKVERRSCGGEFMVDLAHSTYPPYELSPFKTEYWAGALDGVRPLQVRLALESEWGKQHQREATLCAVLADAIKIAAIRASVKVMVYGCQDGKHGDEILRLLCSLRDQSRDDAPWLCIGVPWTGTAKSWRCSHSVLPPKA